MQYVRLLGRMQHVRLLFSTKMSPCSFIKQGFYCSFIKQVRVLENKATAEYIYILEVDSYNGLSPLTLSKEESTPPSRYTRYTQLDQIKYTTIIEFYLKLTSHFVVITNQ